MSSVTAGRGLPPRVLLAPSSWWLPGQLGPRGRACGRGGSGHRHTHTHTHTLPSCGPAAPSSAEHRKLALESHLASPHQLYGLGLHFPVLRIKGQTTPILINEALE